MREFLIMFLGLSPYIVGIDKFKVKSEPPKALALRGTRATDNHGTANAAHHRDRLAACL
jgi:hypothetical protein